MLDLLIYNIGVLATPTGNKAKSGVDQGRINIETDMAIGVTGEIITYVGKASDAPESKEKLDAKGKLVTPGLVDSHTHAVFGGWRHDEMSLKLEGASYLDILKSGGGILSTVKSTREATKEELIKKSEKILKEMVAHGTTTVEIKSGYGLNLETELKQLEVINYLKNNNIMDVVPTFMGAHAFPNEYKGREEEFVDYVCEVMIPEVAKTNIAKYCDIFCETAVFDVEQTRRVLECAKSYGFVVKMHGDEIDPIGGAELAAEVGAVSAEHLIQSSDEGIKKMGEKNVVAVLLPATSLYLDKPFARAKTMIDNNVPVAISTDFNPGSSPNINLQIPMSLGTMRYKMTPSEVLTAVTLNGAAAIGMEEKVGSIEVGKQADIVIWDSESLNYLFYRYGSNLVDTVVKKGIVVF